MLAFSRRMSRRVVASRFRASEAAWNVLEALEPRQLLSGSQLITPVPATQTAAAGSAVSIEVQYSTSDNDNTLTGLGLRMHYDSSKLTFNNLTGVLQTALIGQGTPQADTADFDGDPATDRFVLVSWADMMGNWPNTALPLGLYTANFTTSPSFSGSTAVRFSASSTAVGYTLQATPATVTAGVQAPEIVVEYSGTNIADGDSTPSTSEGTDFGTVLQGAAAVSRTFTVRNTGTAALTTSGLTVPAGYSVTEGLSATIPAGGSDTFTVQLSTASVGTFSGQISFANNDADESPFNFAITGIVATPLPVVAITDVILTEGDSGTKAFTFEVTLSGTNAQGVSVSYATADGTAIAGEDFQPVSGSLTWPAGDTSSRTVTVLVIGDTTFEPDETFYVNLSSPTNATLGKSQGIGTIEDDDGVLPSLSINNATDFESNWWTKSFNFIVSLNGSNIDGASVSYFTVNGTATAGSDYVYTQGSLTWPPGDTSPKTITIEVYGDRTFEQDETFFVDLVSPTNATLTRSRGVGTIWNDDQPNQSPQARLSPPSRQDEAKWFFRVRYIDDTQVNTATVGRNDVEVRGPNSFRQTARFVSGAPTADGGYLAEYWIKAPNRTWAKSPKGKYYAYMLQNAVLDEYGSPVPAGKLGMIGKNSAASNAPAAAGALLAAGEAHSPAPAMAPAASSAFANAPPAVFNSATLIRSGTDVEEDTELWDPHPAALLR